MTDTAPTSAPMPQFNPQAFSAAATLQAHLEKAQMEQDAIEILVGKFIGTVMDRLIFEVLEAVGKETLTSKTGMNPEVALAQQEIAEKYQQKTGKTILQRREEIADQLLADFEQQG